MGYIKSSDPKEHSDQYEWSGVIGAPLIKANNMQLSDNEKQYGATGDLRTHGTFLVDINDPFKLVKVNNNLVPEYSRGEWGELDNTLSPEERDKAWAQVEGRPETIKALEAYNKEYSDTIPIEGTSGWARAFKGLVTAATGAAAAYATGGLATPYVGAAMGSIIGGATGGAVSAAPTALEQHSWTPIARGGVIGGVAGGVSSGISGVVAAETGSQVLGRVAGNIASKLVKTAVAMGQTPNMTQIRQQAITQAMQQMQTGARTNTDLSTSDTIGNSQSYNIGGIANPSYSPMESPRQPTVSNSGELSTLVAQARQRNIGAELDPSWLTTMASMDKEQRIDYKQAIKELVG